MKTRIGGTALVFVAVVAPIVVAVAILVLRGRWFPAGDMAQAELHMRGFFHRPPLVGAAGRIVSDTGFQGSHPGPSLWFAMLPVYLIGNRTSDALMAAAASVHIASIAGILFLARRRFGRPLMIAMAIVLLAVLRSSGTDFMIEPWNPWLALLPFSLFVFLIAELAVPIGSWTPSRDRLLMVLGVIVGSHCVQSHAGYTLLVVPPLAFVLVQCSIRAIGSASDRRFSSKLRARGVLVAVAVGAIGVMWLAPFVDQVRRKPGNMTILLQHFGSPEEPTLGIRTSLDILMSQLNLVGPWLFGPEAPGSSAAKWVGFLGFIALFVSGAAMARDRSQRQFFLVLMAFIVLGAVSILRIFGPFYEYTVRWLWLLAGTTIAWCSVVICQYVNTRRNSSMVLLRKASAATIVGLLVLSFVSIGQVVDRVKMPGATDSRILAGVIEDTEQRLDREKTYQVRFYDPYTLNATGFGLVLELERRGFDVKVDPEFAAAALPHRTAPMQDTDEVIWVVVGPALERALTDPALTLIASYNPRTEQEQERSKQLLEDVEAGLREAGRFDLVASLESPGASILFTEPPLPDETAELVRELIRMGQPSGVFTMAVSDIAVSLG